MDKSSKFPHMKLLAAKSQIPRRNKESDDCSICLLALKEGDYVVTACCTTCIHQKCIEQVIQKKCPLCRADFTISQLP